MGANDVQLHPLALAGWIGLWVTSVNLLPVGQLDGGHISYAVFGKFAIWVARGAFAVLVAAGLLWNGWFIWALFVLFLVRLRHPAPLDDDVPLGFGRQVVGWLVFLMCIATFIPIPVTVVS